MRVKILIIVGLICTVFGSAIVGTLSSYTSTSDYGVGIVPDSDRIVQQYEAKNPTVSDAEADKKDKKQTSLASNSTAAEGDVSIDAPPADQENANTDTAGNSSNASDANLDQKGADNQTSGNFANEKKDNSLQEETESVLSQGDSAGTADGQS